MAGIEQDYVVAATDQLTPAFANKVRNMLSTYDREDVSSAAVATVSQTLLLTYFSAYVNMVSKNVTVPTGNTAAAATPTLCRVGLYTIDGAGNLTLVASTVNDTAMFSAANAHYVKPWQVPVTINKGQRYALGTLVVTGVATPTLNGAPVIGAIAATTPRLNGSLAAQADLPSSITAASVATTNAMVYGELRP